MSFQPKQKNQDHSFSQVAETAESQAEFAEPANSSQLETILGRINAIMTDGSTEELLAQQKVDENSLQTEQSSSVVQTQTSQKQTPQAEPLVAQPSQKQTQALQNDHVQDQVQAQLQAQEEQKTPLNNSVGDVQQSLDGQSSLPFGEVPTDRGGEYQASEPLDMLQPYSEVLNEVRDYFNDRHSLDPKDSLAKSQNSKSITEEVIASSLQDEVKKPKKILLWGDAPLDPDQPEPTGSLPDMNDKSGDANGGGAVSNLSPADFGFGQQQVNKASYLEEQTPGTAQNELAQRAAPHELNESSQIFSPIKFENPFSRQTPSVDVLGPEDNSGQFKQLRHELVDRIAQLEQVIGHHFGDRKEIANEAAQAAMKLAIANLDDSALGRRLADVETAFILYQKNQSQKNQETQETIEKLGQALLKMESLSQASVEKIDAQKLDNHTDMPLPARQPTDEVRDVEQTGGPSNIGNVASLSSDKKIEKPSELSGNEMKRSSEYRVDEIQVPTQLKEQNNDINDNADLSSRIKDLQSSTDEKPPLLSPEALNNFDNTAGVTSSENEDINAIAKLRQAMSSSASERTFGKPVNEAGVELKSSPMSASPSNGAESAANPGGIRGDDFLAKSATLRDQFNNVDIVSKDSDLHTMQPRGLRAVVLIVVIALLLAATGIAFRGNTQGFQEAIYNILATAKGVIGIDSTAEKTTKSLTQTEKNNKEQNELKGRPLNSNKSDDRLGSLIKKDESSSLLVGKEPEITGNIGETALKPDQPLEQTVLDGGGVKLGMPPALIGPYSLRLAASRGDVRAEYEVARRFSYGLGVPKDAEQAVKWYMQGASKGFAPSQYRLATYYERGRGIEKNLGRAKVWYQRAAMLGNVKAMHNLAVISTALDKEDTNYKAAIYWFKQAANRNLADSQFNLAILYQNGVGLSKDNVEAYKWFSLAARQGDVDAASRRDTLEKKLKKEELLKASQILQGWRALTIDSKANDVGRISSHITSTMSHAHETVSRSRVLTAQILLRKLGYVLNTADGSMNEETIRAIKKFEKDKGMPITGKINPDLIQKLNKASL